MNPKYTIEDIAEKSGVSRGTVSRVLNNHPAVSAETRAKVLAVMERFNYRPSFSARQMRTDTSSLIGFFTDEVVTTPYAVDIIRGAQEALWARGKMMMIVSGGYDASLTKTSIGVLLERRVEGILYAAMYHHAVDVPPEAADVPLVLVNCFARHGTYATFVPDEEAGGYAATRHLLERGHRRIGFLNLGDPGLPKPPPVPAATGRLEGYKKALAEAGVPYDPDLLRYTSQATEESYRLTLELLGLPNPPTAIFCGNDRTAMGAYAAINACGLRIPADVAVVGFDNILDITEGLWPQLTSVQLPHYEMGRLAVEYLFGSKPGHHQPRLHKVDCPLVVRAST